MLLQAPFREQLKLNDVSYLAGLKGLKSSSSKVTRVLCCLIDFACRVVSAVLNLAMKLSSLVLNWNVRSRSNTSMALSTGTETRRLRGDQIEVFNISNGYENIDRNIRLDIRKYSFSKRTIN